MNTPLTREQKQFATENHSLVFGFLRKRHLPDDYYDIVIFGYLEAVRQYLTEPALQRYAFTTIAWKKMTTELRNHYKMLKCQKRNVEVVSIHTKLYRDGLTLEDILPARNVLMDQLEDQMALHELAKRVSGQQMDIVRMKSSGYGIRDIARTKKVSMYIVRNLLKKVRDILLEMCRA